MATPKAAPMERAKVTTALMLGAEDLRRRRDAYVAEVDTFLYRATDEGLLRTGFPDGWVSALLPELMKLMARQLPELSHGQAADVVVDTLLRGVGA